LFSSDSLGFAVMHTAAPFCSYYDLPCFTFFLLFFDSSSIDTFDTLRVVVPFGVTPQLPEIALLSLRLKRRRLPLFYLNLPSRASARNLLIN